MSKELPRLVRSEKRAVVYEECGHDEAITKLSDDHNSMDIVVDRKNGRVEHSQWLDTEENRKYVEDSGGQVYYCRLAEVRGPRVGELLAAKQPPVITIPPGITFVNYDGEEVVAHPGDRIEITVNDEGMARVSKV